MDPVKDALYTYDSTQQKQINNVKPWRSDPNHFTNVRISAVALLKMVMHARSGGSIEVMGLMLGEFVDEYTVQVIDVFAMPQSGTTVTVESVDHVFQTKMVEMLKQTGR